jgi:predicted MFS family arabinose efflux permease
VRRGPPEERKSSFRRQVESTLSTLRREREVRIALAANALWETALNAMRAFVVLYFTVGLGFSGTETSLVLLIVAIAALVVAPITGMLSDRFGEERILRLASLVYAAGVWVPAFFHSPWVLLVIPPVAASAVMVMTLPFSLLMSVLPDDAAEGEMGGGGSGLFGISRGIGLLLGPLCGGLAIVACRDVLSSTQGYGAVFLVAAVAIAASAVVIRRLDASPAGKPLEASA